MAAIRAGRQSARGAGRSVVVLESARKPGAKILISGGGRCNVTHDEVTESDFAGALPRHVRGVLRRFDVPHTVAFFEELGVRLKREETGKLFPVTDTSRTVLEALLRAARAAGVELRHPCRVERIERRGDRFLLSGDWGDLAARQVILATGGRSLPKSGSDGHGYALARSLGHSLTERIFPALVPLLLPDGHLLRSLSGVSAAVSLEVRSSTGARLARAEGAMLCTHFGISGPAVLDISRHYLAARHEDAGVHFVVGWLPGCSFEETDALLAGLGSRTPGSWLRASLPERLARALCQAAGVDPAGTAATLTRDVRRRLAALLVGQPLPVSGDRGFGVAEVTAGGVPLNEVRLDSMRSRICPGLLLCGEILAVDGRVGGYNFQWAWSTGHIAGMSVWNEPEACTLSGDEA